MKALIAALLLLGCAAQKSSAYLLVEDIPNLTHAIVSQIANYAKYIQEVINQTTQITNQITSIENQIIQLERFGDPRTYVNMLQLGTIIGNIQKIEGGIGQIISDYRSIANGALAIGYTANGLYENLTGKLDKFGVPINWNTDNFKKFATVQSMTEDYNTQQKSFNTQLKSLQDDLAATLKLLDGDKTLVGKTALAAKANAQSAQINALSHVTNLKGQQLQAQVLSNANDAGRIQEATRQQLLQERKEDLQMQAKGWGVLVGAQ